MELAKAPVDRRTAGTLLAVRLLHEWYVTRLLKRKRIRDPLLAPPTPRENYKRYLKPKRKQREQKAYVIHKEQLP